MVTDGLIADYELLIVDDASTDRTPELADALAAADRHVRVVHHERNRKLGGSIKTGFANATGDLILYSDADLPFDMEEIPRAVRLLTEYEVDIVSAYRFDRTGEGYLRAIYTFFYNLLIRWMFRVKARDINFAFKLLHRRVFDHIELQSEGSFIDAELIIRATRWATRSSRSVSTTSPAPRRVHAQLADDHRQDPRRDAPAARRAEAPAADPDRALTAGPTGRRRSTPRRHRPSRHRRDDKREPVRPPIPTTTIHRWCRPSRRRRCSPRVVGGVAGGPATTTRPPPGGVDGAGDLDRAGPDAPPSTAAPVVVTAPTTLPVTGRRWPAPSARARTVTT